MKMMGAYDSFIKSPFIVEGCIVGLAGSLTAFAVSLATYSLLGKAMGSIGIASLLDVLPFNEMAYAILAAENHVFEIILPAMRRTKGSCNVVGFTVLSKHCYAGLRRPGAGCAAVAGPH